MGNFVNDVVNVATLGLVDDVTGTEAAADAARGASAAQVQAGREAIQAQRAAAERGQEFLAPFGGVGQQALGQLGVLTDPQQQMQFLQSNPLFQMALDNANRQTQQQAAASGRLSAGDTLQQLSNNVLLSAQPLLQNQQRNVAGLLDFGRGLATTQANVELGQGSQIGNLLTQIGNAQAAGIVGAENPQQQFTQGLMNIGGTLGGAAFMASDKRLKSNIKPLGEKNGHKWYTWEWNEKARKLLGLVGKQEGVIAQEVESYMPEAIKEYQGFKTVDYSMLGVN